jgi:hypothetical protein
LEDEVRDDGSFDLKGTEKAFDPSIFGLFLRVTQ